MCSSRPTDDSTPERTPRKRTRAEQETIDVVARSHGRAYAEEHAALILLQARSVGLLDEPDDD